MTSEVQERYRTATIVAHFRADDQNDVRTCDCCGQGLWNVNSVRLADGATVFLGNDCVERVGLSTPELKAWWRAKFAEQRWAAQRARWAAQDAENRAKVNGLPQRDELIAYYHDAQAAWEQRGGHGDVLHGQGRRFRDIFSDWCHDAVEMGAHLAAGGSPRAIRVEGAAENMAAFVPEPFRSVEDAANDTVFGRALFDLDGNLIPARLVDGKFGMSWMVLDDWDGRATGEFLNPSKARNPETARRNNAKKGFYEGRVRYRGNVRRRWVCRDEPPVVILDNGLLDGPDPEEDQ